MKKINLLLLVFTVLAINSMAQNSPTWPSSGNVGIGTDNPIERLDLGTGGNLRIRSGSYGNNGLIRFYGTDTNEKLQMGALGDNNAFLYTPASVDLSIYAGNTERLTIKSGGNIGLGTAHPTNRLTLSNTAYGTSNDVGIDFSASNASYTPVYARIALGINTALANAGTGYLAFSTIHSDVLSEQLRITSTGNVGIGTTTPDSKLTVAGRIHSQEVKVTIAAGADFVFEQGYNLRSLLEIEKFIKQNKHLPEIASASEMIKDGINLGEMNIKLLQKIEELTLHLIEKDKTLTEVLGRLKKLEDNK